MDFVDADIRNILRFIAEVSELNIVARDDMKNFLSERGTVSVDERTNTLIIRDTSKNIEEIKNLFR